MASTQRKLKKRLAKRRRAKEIRARERHSRQQALGALHTFRRTFRLSASKLSAMPEQRREAMTAALKRVLGIPPESGISLEKLVEAVNLKSARASGSVTKAPTNKHNDA